MFKVIFTIAAPAAATLTVADDTAAPRITGQVEKLGGQGIPEKSNLYNSPHPGLYPRGNVSGQFIVHTSCSYKTLANQHDSLVAFYNAINTQGTVVLTMGAGIYTMANAVLASVERTYLNGVRLDLRFTFEITTIT